jgi:hypothetical protein
MKMLSRHNGFLLIVGLVASLGFMNSGCENTTSVSGTAVNLGGESQEQNANISVSCSGSNFNSKVLEEGAFNILVALADAPCSFNDTEYLNAYGDIEVYECVSPNCTFTIVNQEVQNDLSEVSFAFDCMLIDDCVNYCANKGVCPGGSVCGDCLDLCESVRCLQHTI